MLINLKKWSYWQFLLILPLALGKVVQLTAENFEGETLKGQWYIEFYAPWCGHCKNFGPIYEKASEEMKDKINFGQVDATVEKDLAETFHVDHYPTVKLCAEHLHFFLIYFYFFILKKKKEN
ncbi:hypothetical protein RFI_11137 [Reticulomyxa filosa]|uniref:Thioredoxin domain-containing protein n=1 Tax=Reticulomyxa filosa TaxID=46433 RepID=X6NI55_RETFI|nr:hypothetical protein RFI_11137 [Reticulomyxa filosa]|eukprot:ETO26000.1 hypothetical protein RFI_11137 [Reticulomyxa filosa]